MKDKKPTPEEIFNRVDSDLINKRNATSELMDSDLDDDEDE